MRHEWGRAAVYLSAKKKGDEEGEEGEVVVEEWTDPSDGDKALFFWNLNGVIMEAFPEKPKPKPKPRDVPTSWWRKMWMELWVTVQLFVIFRDLDNWPVLFDLGDRTAKWSGLSWMAYGSEWMITHSVLLFVGVFGKFCGFRAVTRERTPAKLWENWLEKMEKMGK